MSNIEGNPRPSRFTIEEIRKILKRLYEDIFRGIPEIDSFEVENVEPDATGSALRLRGNFTDVYAQFMSRKFFITIVRVDLIVSSASPNMKLLELDTEKYEFLEEFKLSGPEISQIEEKFTRFLERAIRKKLSDMNRMVRKSS